MEPYLVFDARVLSLRVLTNKDGIDIVIWRLEALDGHARTDVGEQVESSTEGQVKGDVALSDYIIWRVKNVVSGRGEAADVLGVARGPGYEALVQRRANRGRDGAYPSRQPCSSAQKQWRRREWRSCRSSGWG